MEHGHKKRSYVHGLAWNATVDVDNDTHSTGIDGHNGKLSTEGEARSISYILRTTLHC